MCFLAVRDEFVDEDAVVGHAAQGTVAVVDVKKDDVVIVRMSKPCSKLLDDDPLWVCICDKMENPAEIGLE